MSKDVKYDDTHIQVLSDIAHLRKVSNMYIPDVSTHLAQTHLFKEIVQNCFDEGNNTPNVDIDIVFFKGKDTYQVLVQDTGRGVPIYSLNDIYTKTKSSGKWSDAYSCSIGIFGVGATACAALSETFTAVSVRGEGIGSLTMCRGKVKKEFLIPGKPTVEFVEGTSIFYSLDKSILKNVDKYMEEEFEEVVRLLEFSFAFVYKGTIRLRVIDGLVDEKVLMFNPKRILKFFKRYLKSHNDYYPLKTLNRLEYCSEKASVPNIFSWKISKLVKEIEFKELVKTLGYEIEFFIPSKNLDYLSTSLIGTVNRTPIDDPNSVHILGLLKVLKNILKRFEDNSDIKNFIELNYKIPIVGYCLILYTDVVFVGQTKNSFKDTDFLKDYTKQLEKHLDSLGEEIWRKFYCLLEKDIKRKYDKYVKRAFHLNSNLKNVTSRLNNDSCYCECASVDSSITELFISEGNSAGGAVSQVCEKEYQAVFKSRGKPTNFIKKSDPFKDSLFTDLITIMGVSPKHTNLDNINFNKIIILCDADAHGYHISALWVTILFKINPLILSEGKVFLSNPPLYSFSSTKKDTRYLQSKKDLIELKIKVIYEKFFHIFINKIRITGAIFKSFCRTALDIGEVIEECANYLTIDPALLERLIFCVDYLDPKKPNLPKIKSILKLDNVVFNKDFSSLILVDGDDELFVRLAGIKKIIKEKIIPAIGILDWDRTSIQITTLKTNKLNKDPITLVELYLMLKIFDKKFKINRFKGLGGMSNSQLFFTCVNKDTRDYFPITQIGDVDVFYQLFGVKTDARKKLVNEI